MYSLKEIGERLRETRESIGVSIDEAAEDLKLRPSQIEALEAGNIENFKDIYYLKYFIRDYSKYLGLNYEDMIDEFNEYLFDYTSKISIEDIKKNKQELLEEPKGEKTIHSPYTIEHKKEFRLSKRIILIIVSIIILIGCILAYNEYIRKDDKPSESVVMQTL